MIRLTFICNASTTAARRAAFPLDEPLDRHGIVAAKALSPVTPGRALASPALRARQTAELLRLDAAPEPALRDLDYGRWAGKTIADVAMEDQDGVAAWRADPHAAPHGGESVAALFERVREFLDRVPDGVSIAVTHAAVMRAAVAIALDAPVSSFWKIDIAPLGRVSINGDDGNWRLRSILD
jgi:broad specificity phosphatase PhoE